MNFSDRLKLARKSLGKSQNELAEAIDVSVTAVQSYESGRQFPGGKVFEALARMGFDTNWLLTGEGEMMRGRANVYTTNGNGIFQGHHVTAEEIPIDVHAAGHAADPRQGYLPPDAENAELLLMLKRYGNRALIDDLRARLLKIKAAVEG